MSENSSRRVKVYQHLDKITDGIKADFRNMNVAHTATRKISQMNDWMFGVDKQEHWGAIKKLSERDGLHSEAVGNDHQESSQ